MIRVLIVEDSAVQREFLSFVLEEAGEFEVIGTAVDGEDGIDAVARLRPDIVLMDCHMPKLDGIGATRVIMEKTPTPIVMTSASTLQGEVQITFEAVKNGALAVVRKPPAFGSPDFDRVAGEMVRTLRLMSEVKVVRRWPARTAKPAPPSDAARPVPATGTPSRIVAIAGSTGAPAVIGEILAGLGPSFAAPVLVVQHMAEGFIEGFAGWLAGHTGMPVSVARDGQQTLPGNVYLAPDGMQMGVDSRGRIMLSSGADDEGFKPSGNFLLRSVATSFGASAIGIVLTGMGRDGAAGLLELQRSGGVTIAQDEPSCVVFGMPREAIRNGAAAHVMPASDMITLLASLARRPEQRSP